MGWIARRWLTLSLLSGFGAWYLLELAVAAASGMETAAWWFYVGGEPSPGYLLAPVSHNVADTDHLRWNTLVLLFAGSLAEPRVGRRRYLAVLFGGAAGTLAAANLLAPVAPTGRVAAGPSGGIYCLWTYAGVRHRSLLRRPSGRREWVEAVGVGVGFGLPVLVPAFDWVATGRLNAAHLAGVGLGVALGVGAGAEPAERAGR